MAVEVKGFKGRWRVRARKWYRVLQGAGGESQRGSGTSGSFLKSKPNRKIEKTIKEYKT